MGETARDLGLTPMSDAPQVGPLIRQRRERMGMTSIALAAEAQVDRGRLRSLENGDPSVRQSTIKRVLEALDKIEHRLGVPPVDEERESERTVRISIRGNFGVETTIEGSARDQDALEAMAARLIERMSAQQAERSPDPDITSAVGEAIRKHRPQNGKDQPVTGSEATS